MNTGLRTPGKASPLQKRYLARSNKDSIVFRLRLTCIRVWWYLVALRYGIDMVICGNYRGQYIKQPKIRGLGCNSSCVSVRICLPELLPCFTRIRRSFERHKKFRCFMNSSILMIKCWQVPGISLFRRLCAFDTNTQLVTNKWALYYRVTGMFPCIWGAV